MPPMRNETRVAVRTSGTATMFLTEEVMSFERRIPVKSEPRMMESEV